MPPAAQRAQPAQPEAPEAPAPPQALSPIAHPAAFVAPQFVPNFTVAPTMPPPLGGVTATGDQAVRLLVA